MEKNVTYRTEKNGVPNPVYQQGTVLSSGWTLGWVKFAEWKNTGGGSTVL